MQTPETLDRLKEILSAASGGDRAAFDFLCAFHTYLEEAASYLVSKSTDQGRLIAIFAATATLYSMPFYSRHCAQLRVPIALAIGELGEAVVWSKDPEVWQADWVKAPNKSLADVVTAVATITVGFAEARKVSAAIKQFVWATTD